jgi:cytochrome c peroxidase
MRRTTIDHCRPIRIRGPLDLLSRDLLQRGKPPRTCAGPLADRQYFKLLIDEPWVWRKWCVAPIIIDHGRADPRNGPAQYEDKKSKSLMMLPTDMALIKDKSFKKYAQQYAKSEEDFFKE